MSTRQDRAGLVRDQAQVIAMARGFRNQDQIGTLATSFTVPPPATAEEGWILGVV